nr:integrase, catalytic region, zinc finger, CCHC-type, peptidase aspartic, catalytic [Tanacetum cinerariifolium]
MLHRPLILLQVVQIILFILDSGCTKYMTGNLKFLCNFDEKYLGTMRFGNDQFAPILGYRDLVRGNVIIKMVYYIEGLNHNLFSVGQFCYADLKVAFKKSTCFVRDLQGNDLLTGACGSDLYTISIQKTSSPTPICFMAKASPTQAWLWNRRLSHLNFDTINLLSKTEIVNGLLKLKFIKDQLYPSCEMGKEKKRTTLNVQPTLEPITSLININAKETNIDQADAQFKAYEFINPFCTPVQKVPESSSRNTDTLNMYTFYQRKRPEYHWSKDHPIEQVRGDPSKRMQTRQQLSTNAKMCMFALIVSTTEPKNIKEAMDDHAWIKAMQEELHQFDRLKV